MTNQPTDEIEEILENYGAFVAGADLGDLLTKDEAKAAVQAHCRKQVVGELERLELPHTYPKDRFPRKDLSQAAAIGAMNMWEESKKYINERIAELKSKE